MVVAVVELTVTLGWPGAGSEEGVDIHIIYAPTKSGVTHSV